MKVLFLDVDGVLNCEAYLKKAANGGIVGMDPFRVLLVHRILDATDAKVVVSSTWRLIPPSKDEVIKAVSPHYLDSTPQLKLEKGQKPAAGWHNSRGMEISEWLKEHPEVTKYAILDDERGAGYGHPPENVFKTEWYGGGLTEEIAEKVIEHLK